nr:hypothetical protein [Oceanivirga sp.]
MKKDYYISLYIFMFQSLLAIWIFKQAFFTDKFTVILLIAILTIPSFFDIFIQNELRRNKEIKSIKLNNYYFIFSIILYLFSIFMIGLNITNFNILSICIVAAMLSIANTIRTWSWLKYSKKIILYKNKTISQDNIKKVRYDKNILSIINKDNNSINIKF